MGMGVKTPPAVGMREADEQWKNAATVKPNRKHTLARALRAIRAGSAEVSSSRMHWEGPRGRIYKICQGADQIGCGQLHT